MKLRWRLLALVKGRHKKKQLNSWIFLGLMTALSLAYMIHQEVHEYFHHSKARDGSGDMPRLKDKGEETESLEIELETEAIGINRRTHLVDRPEYHSSDEIELNDHIQIEENEMRHMGIYRKTLSKTFRKSNKQPSDGTNSSSQRDKDVISGGYSSRVVEVTNLKDEQSENVSLEADGYMSVMDAHILVVDPEKAKAKSKQLDLADGTGIYYNNKKQDTVIGEKGIVNNHIGVINQNAREIMKKTNVIGSHTEGGQLKKPGRRNLNKGQQTGNVKTKSMIKTGDKHEFVAIQKCNEVRMKRIRERCEDLDFKSLQQSSAQETKSLANKIITDNRHKVLINAVPKTGTSSWKMVMLNNSGLVISENGQLPPGNAINDWRLLKSYGLEDLKSYDEDEIRFRLQNYYSILTVRHPFERLESTFREKFHNSQNKVYMQTVAKKIVAKYRQGNSSSAANSTIPDGPVQVTFEEFLRYALSPESHDRHWNTYWNIANPCVLPYRYIAKTETADLDMDFIAATKLSQGQSRGSFKYNPTRLASTMDSQSQGNTLELFSRLNPESQNALLFATLDKYMNDMELFGYRIHKEGQKVVSQCHYYSTEGLCC